MGLSETKILCMKHPNHKQRPGVCSCCLIEKLSKLSLGPFIIISSPANYQYYSSGSSSPSSHTQRPAGHLRRTASGGLSSSGGGGGGGLKKSKSVAVTVGGGRGRDGVNGKKKKQGFWSKFMKSTTGKRTKEGYVHPRIKDRLVF